MTASTQSHERDKSGQNSALGTVSANFGAMRDNLPQLCARVRWTVPHLPTN